MRNSSVDLYRSFIEIGPCEYAFLLLEHEIIIVNFGNQTLFLGEPS